MPDDKHNNTQYINKYTNNYGKMKYNCLKQIGREGERERGGGGEVNEGQVRIRGG